MAQPPSSTGWFPSCETTRNQHRDLETAYASSVRMKGRAGTALLIDTGSPGNIVGSEWSKEMAFECDRAGVSGPTYTPRASPLVCSGSGSGSQQTEWDVTHTISVGDGRQGSFTAPELPDSKVPGLWGQRSMKEKRCLIDTFTAQIFEVGAGHLMLPCSRFDVPKKPYVEVTSFVVGEYFNAKPAHSNGSGLSGGSPPAYTSTGASRKGSQDVDPTNRVDNVINRAYDELDMLVANGLSKMD